MAERLLNLADVAAAFPDLQNLAPLGEPGGSGECWSANAEQGPIAIKVLVAVHDEARFDREVAGLQRVESSNVMKVFEAGAVMCGGQERPYMKSELITGGNLRSLLGGGPVGVSDVADCAVGLLRGLVALDGSDVVHRDLKPENVVLRGGSLAAPVIIDLGLCRLGPNSSLTEYPWYCGTYRYSSPEQLRFEPAISRSDVWAVGVMALEMLGGVHPFFPGDFPADHLGVLRSGVRLSDDVPHDLSAALLAMTSFAAYKRPSAARILEMLGV